MNNINCPKCGSPMTFKTSKKQEHTVNNFRTVIKDEFYTCGQCHICFATEEQLQSNRQKLLKKYEQYLEQDTRARARKARRNNDD